MKKEKFYSKIKNCQNNVKFVEMVNFLLSLGFKDRSRGTGHKIFTKEGVNSRINIQNNNGEVYPYQVRQIIEVIKDNNLL